MNDAIRIVLLLSLASLEAAELLIEQRTNSIHRLVQANEDESTPAATAFLAQVSATTLENDSIEDFTAFIDALAANASAARNESESSGDGDTFEDASSDFTPALSSASDASISLDQDVGSSSSSSGEMELEIDGDANLAGGGNILSSVSTMQHPSGFLVLLTIALIIEFATWFHHDGQ